jgi:hypothetical protein
MFASMDWLIILLIAVVASTLAGLVWLLVTQRGSPVEMPGGETIFGAPRQPERPSPHRSVEE